MNPVEVQEAIMRCRRCSYIDKPPCRFRIYENYVPPVVRVLVVSESPPPGRKDDYIYNTSRRDRLRSALAKAFQVPENQVIGVLLEHGVFWSTAVKCRPLSKSVLEEMRRNCLEILTVEVETLRPERIVALGTMAWKSVEDLGLEERLRVDRHYHPLYLARFQRHRLGELKQLILG